MPGLGFLGLFIDVAIEKGGVDIVLEKGRGVDIAPKKGGKRVGVGMY